MTGDITLALDAAIALIALIALVGIFAGIVLTRALVEGDMAHADRTAESLQRENERLRRELAEAETDSADWWKN